MKLFELNEWLKPIWASHTLRWECCKHTNNVLHITNSDNLFAIFKTKSINSSKIESKITLLLHTSRMRFASVSFIQVKKLSLFSVVLVFDGVRLLMYYTLLTTMRSGTHWARVGGNTELFYLVVLNNLGRFCTALHRINADQTEQRTNDTQLI